MWSFVGLVVIGLAALIAVSLRRVPAAPAAVLLAMSTPLALWGGFSTMAELVNSDPSFDVSGFLLQPVPGLLVAVAAVVAAHAVRASRQSNSRRVVLSTTVLSYVAAVLAVLAALFSVAAMLGQGG
ncbi:hypothetical protein GCM10009630_50550 [Kribbella jejuensis]|uniref:Uncharacterized protein n=1 Tax=Kribbella jejuensis TaxID=236068 RepID=A0A542D9W1_9ACTN|nr:hypothetical protein FB475_6844 [Kribbella jejuensis]